MAVLYPTVVTFCMTLLCIMPKSIAVETKDVSENLSPGKNCYFLINFLLWDTNLYFTELLILGDYGMSVDEFSLILCIRLTVALPYLLRPGVEFVYDPPPPPPW